MVLKGKEPELDAARKLAIEKLKGPGTLLSGLQILGYLQEMESATTEKAFCASQRSLFGIEINRDPFE